ncbi:response regulator [Xylophilus sp. GOD-11R]|uniref:response regulator n=1 Tax=Xylophilus sp. GOD-11R TaxID=3089814 RepID=UPI00298C675A|nr:response regulator [Xylophilus sp. GOD-11R]WPB59212.1 response regulator [Xylophilus sp. GOD-11R]
MRVLFVEDTPDLADAVLRCLRRMGHAADWQSDGQAADSLLEHHAFDLVVLDIGLPRMNGTEILARMRERGDKTPVLMLTARADIEDRVAALDSGADDYLGKPFDFREFEARCRALLRRKQGQVESVQRIGGLVIDSAARRVTLDGVRLDLPNREYSLLDILVGRLGRVVRRDEIAAKLFSFDDEAGSNAIDLYVGRLRKKLGEGPVRITTVRSIGYLAEAMADDADGSTDRQADDGAELGP